MLKQKQVIIMTTKSSTTNISHSSNMHLLSINSNHMLSLGNTLLLSCSSSNSRTTNSSISRVETHTTTVISLLDVELIKVPQTLLSNKHLHSIMAVDKEEAGLLLSKTETIVSTTHKVVTTIEKRA